MPYLGAARPAAASTPANAPRSSARWMASGLVPTTGHAGRLQGARQAQRGLPTELDDHASERAAGLLGVHHFEHVLQRQGLEVQPPGRVVVGRDGLGVAVDHDRLVTGVGQRERRVHAGVVELDALADPVRPAAQDDHLGPVPGRDLGLVVVGGVQVGGAGGEFGRAGVHRVEHRPHAETPADLPDAGLAHPAQLADLGVGEAGPLGGPQRVGVQRLCLPGGATPSGGTTSLAPPLRCAGRRRPPGTPRCASRPAGYPAVTPAARRAGGPDSLAGTIASP